MEVSGSSLSQDRQSGKKEKKCLVPRCVEENRYPKVHAFRFHVPGIFDERLSPTSEVVLRGRKQALLQAATWLLRRPGTLQDLAEFVKMQRLLSPEHNAGLSKSFDALRAFCDYVSEPIPDTFTLEPVNSVAVLIHWRVILMLAARLEPVEREYWRTEFPAPEEEGMGVFRAFDAHFHLDRTLKAMGLPPGASFQSILDGTPVEAGKEVRLVGTCVSFCDPDTYPTSQGLVALPKDMVVAVGIHPKHRFSRRQEDEAIRALKELVRSQRVTAVGEIGLDHSEPMRRWHDQVVVLEKILPLVEPRHVLVLHCRGMSGDSGAEAYLLLLHLVRKALPKDQRIYLHCFTGDGYVRDQWLEAFANVHFGFTPMVGQFNAHQIQAVRGIKLEKILLETDAPYFTASGARWSAPNQLYRVAEPLAEILKIPVGTLLNTTTSNALRLFHRQ